MDDKRIDKGSYVAGTPPKTEYQQIDPEWLKRKIAADPECEVEAGASHPEAPPTDYQKAREAAARAGALANGDDYMEDYDRHWTFLNAALSAFEAHGLVLVPARPTPAMVESAFLRDGYAITDIARTPQEMEPEIMAIRIAHANRAALQERQKK